MNDDSITIKNARFVVTQNGQREVLENTDVLVSNGRIAEIGKNLPKDGEVFDAGKKIAIPGLINSHTHSPMAIFRGLADDRGHHSWLHDHIFPMEKNLNNDIVYYGSLISMLEKISTGTTTFNEMYSYIDVIAKAVNKTGMRAFLSSGLKDHNDGEKTESEIRRARGILSAIKENGNDLIKPMLSLHWTLTCSDELIRKTLEIDSKLPVFMHVSETAKEVEENLRIYGKRPVERLDAIGALSKRFCAVHAVNLNDGEIDILKRRGCKVIYNPTSNMKLACGISPVKKLIDKGICVAIGTDGAGSNDNLNLVEEMKIGSLLQKIATMDAGAIRAKDAFDMATVNGAVACMDSGIGSIEKANWQTLLSWTRITPR